jgi:hypothetical protein
MHDALAPCAIVSRCDVALDCEFFTSRSARLASQMLSFAKPPGVFAMTKDLQLIVDQPSTGHFYWTIVDLGGHGEEQSVVDYARGPLPTRSSAMVAGMTALAEHQRTRICRLGQMSGARFDGNSEMPPGGLLHAQAL